MFVDGVLPFGLRSAPKIFNVLADALLWIMYRRGIHFGLHYLDDFLFAGPPGSTEREAALAVAIECCRILGVPIAVEKTVGPSTKITFLGIEVDSEEGLLSLPQEKLVHTKSVINTVLGKDVKSAPNESYSR